MMLAAAFGVKKAADAGLAPALGEVLAPGSKATELLLERAGCWTGCGRWASHVRLRLLSASATRPILTSCRGRGHRAGQRAVGQPQLEGRISPDVSQNYPAAPAAVIAYALAPWTWTSSTTRWERAPTAPRCSWPTSGPATRRSPRWWPSMWTAPCTRRARAACTTAMRPGPRWAANPATRSAGTTRPPTCAAPRTSTAWSASPPRRSPLRPLARWRCWATSSPPTTSPAGSIAADCPRPAT
ncbi:MAG: hypothetical protein ACLT98_07580 [Eggerthellaceae bacterium]